MIFLILNTLYRKLHQPSGFLFGLFLVLLFTIRFFMEFFKADQVAFEAEMALNMGQWLSIPFILFGSALLLLKRKPLPL
ncbi:prolipoprotein diacylglyceryl transferase family protein [Catalinimonas alkaloidigena]|uniref:prolipoprotein diacylglyceryl transferase family protein n=1 Tax=Catalinimonas alkaloidigena TaxID=1075417 RepID=UPI002406F71E|nr:prolipoprotein diacylglyceryl transferase family protein [Catalinimonas alkaloidigena]